MTEWTRRRWEDLSRWFAELAKPVTLDPVEAELRDVGVWADDTEPAPLHLHVYKGPTWARKTRVWSGASLEGLPLDDLVPSGGWIVATRGRDTVDRYRVPELEPLDVVVVSALEALEAVVGER